VKNALDLHLARVARLDCRHFKRKLCVLYDNKRLRHREKPPWLDTPGSISGPPPPVAAVATKRGIVLFINRLLRNVDSSLRELPPLPTNAVLL
jgi:hypothetical protein